MTKMGPALTKPNRFGKIAIVLAESENPGLPIGGYCRTTACCGNKFENYCQGPFPPLPKFLANRGKFGAAVDPTAQM